MFTLQELFSSPDAFTYLPIFQVLSRVHFDQDLEFTPEYFKRLGDVTDYQQVVCVIAKLRADPDCLRRSCSQNFTLPSCLSELKDAMPKEDNDAVETPTTTAIHQDAPSSSVEPEQPNVELDDDDLAFLSDLEDDDRTKCETPSAPVAAYREQGKVFLPSFKTMGSTPIRRLYAKEHAARHVLPCPVYNSKEFDGQRTKIKVQGKTVKAFKQSNTKFKSVKRFVEHKYPRLSVPKKEELLAVYKPKIIIYAPKHNAGWFANSGIYHTDAVLSWDKAPNVIATNDLSLFQTEKAIRIGFLDTKGPVNEEVLSWMKRSCDYINIGCSLKSLQHLWTGGTDVPRPGQAADRDSRPFGVNDVSGFMKILNKIRAP